MTSRPVSDSRADASIIRSWRRDALARRSTLPGPGWIATTCGVACSPVRDLGLRDASDRDIFMACRLAEAIIVTKDADFVRLLEQLGPPPQVVWITCGNTSNTRLRELLTASWPTIKSLIDAGESLVELGDALGG